MEKIVQGLAEHLVARGHRCDVVTLNRSFEDGSAYTPYDLHNGVNVYRVPFRGSTRYPIAPKVARFAANYDLIHVHGVDFLVDWLVLNKARHQKPIVLSTHGGFFHTEFAQHLKKTWFHTMTRLTLRGVDRVLASSEHDQGLFEEVSDRVALARNAVDLSVYKNLKNTPVPGRWVCVGRVDVHKGIGALLRTLAEFRKRDERAFEMRIIGPEVVDGLLDKLRSERDRLGLNGLVFFDGRIEFEALHEAVATAELAIFPSEYEAFGISVVEAMGAGVLTVLNDIEPFRDFVEEKGCGFVAPFSEPNRAAEVLSTALSISKAKRKTMTRDARNKALEYDWTATVSRFEELYREVLEGKNGS